MRRERSMEKSPRSALAFIMAGLIMMSAQGCTEPKDKAATPNPGSTTTATATPAAPIDPAAVAAATGGKPEVADGVVKVSFPRDDVKIEVDKWAMPPFMGLASWAGFAPGQKAGVEAMVMGDIVLFEDEVTDAMRAALDAGLEVTALHNHFFFDNPKVFFMHIGGEGKVDALGKGVRAILDATKAIRQKTPQPSDHFDGPAIPTPSAIDGAKVEAAMGVKGTAKDGMYKVVVGRAATKASCGCEVGKVMGVNTWAAFAGADDNAVVDGDFAVTEDELQGVLRSLTKAGIHIVAIHHHMVGEQPRILFLHYWGRGPVDALGKSVKAALDLTKTSK